MLKKYGRAAAEEKNHRDVVLTLPLLCARPNPCINRQDEIGAPIRTKAPSWSLKYLAGNMHSEWMSAKSCLRLWRRFHPGRGQYHSIPISVGPQEVQPFIGDQQPEILGDIICSHIFTIGAVGKVVFRCLKVGLVVIVTIKQQRFHSGAPPSLRVADNLF